MVRIDKSAPVSLNFPPAVLNLTCRARQMRRQDYSITDRLERFSWWNQRRMAGSRIRLIGCGGLGGPIGLMFIQSSVGEIQLIDKDLVEDSNRTRQMYTAEDVGKPKAHQLARALSRFAVGRTRLRAYYMPFERWAKRREAQ